MKYCLLLSLLLLATSLQAASLNCYEGKKRTYHGTSESFIIDPRMIIVVHRGWDEVVYRKNKNTPRCIITKSVS